MPIRFLCFLLCLLACGSVPRASAMFQLMTGENHGELRWRTLSTEHFRVHYPVGLEETARACADVAEQVWEPVTRQLGVEPRRRTELAITDVDQIVNGFAVPGRMSIWVNQNDYVRHFSQRREWLRQVIAHEFQHVVAMEAMHDWRGLSGLALAGVPAWWLEGLAEYYTENWNTLRSDRDLRAESLDRRLPASDAHDAGYARVLYLAWRDGDSTLVRICNWRASPLKTYDFKRAFKACTGQSLENFEEEWTRLMNGVYNAELVAGEPLDEIGRRVTLPMARIAWLGQLPDSSAWLAVGRTRATQLENGLYRIACDSLARSQQLDSGPLKGTASISADGAQVVYDRWGIDRHGSRLTDLWRLELASGERTRLTRWRRAQDPALAPDGALVCIRTLEGRHRLELCESPEAAINEGDAAWSALWDPGPGWQMMSPVFSPDGGLLAVAVDDDHQRKDIFLVERATGRARRLAADSLDQRQPVWLGDSSLVCTVFQDYRANLQELDLAGRSRPLSLSGEGLWSASRAAGRERVVIGLALDSAGVSRPLLVQAAREARAAAAVIQPRYTAWREQLPEIRVPDDPAPTTEVLGDRRYRASELQPFFGLVLPLPGGVAGLLVLMDPLAHNTLSLYGAATDGHSLDGGYGFSLSNLQTSWVLGLNGSWHWDPAFTVYDGQLEELSSSSLEVWARHKWQYPLGLRGSLAAGLGLRVEDTEASDLVFTGGERPLPQGGRSSRVAGSLQWSSAPADRLSRLWPDWAHGLSIEGALLRPWLNGDENVNLLTLQVYRIQPTFLPSLKLVALAGAQVLSGRKDTWRSLGLGADPLLEPLAELSQLGSPLAEAPLGPLWRLRGLNRDLAADRVLYSTIELRQTLGAPDVFNLVGLRNGRLNLATFADLGQLAHRERLGAGLKDPLSLWTSGLELQLGLRGSGSTLFSLAGGYAGNKLEWLDRGDAGRWYWKFHLGRPF